MSRSLLVIALALVLADCGGSTSVGAPDGGGGGSSGTGGSGGFAGGKGDGSIDCSNVGCAPPPMCSTGCTAVCGCCACGEGTVEGDLMCVGGCWKPFEGCMYMGHTYPVGSTFNAGDGCNTCGCALGPGSLACTKKACACDPAAEVRRRQYIGMSPDECATIRYTCTGTTTSFSNSCGCGCEQDPSCPEWFDCQPSPDVPPCDTAAIKMKCPYSGIAL